MTRNDSPGRTSPNEQINIAQIGFGRIAKDHDLPLTMRHDAVRITAVADVDLKRAHDGKRLIEDWYRTNRGESNVDIVVYQDYRELLLDKSIDAVIISTPSSPLRRL
jgi:myo-inositol 2-dehydrogenase/D-chiro-inositol 1-dehydrogenase